MFGENLLRFYSVSRFVDVSVGVYRRGISYSIYVWSMYRRAHGISSESTPYIFDFVGKLSASHLVAFL